jgi:predicted enzyme related to lactoylglutathione lyase
MVWFQPAESPSWEDSDMERVLGIGGYFMRAADLDAMLAQLRAKGADVAKETQDMEGVGRFGWVTDPEGNRIELWQPA